MKKKELEKRIRLLESVLYVYAHPDSYGRGRVGCGGNKPFEFYFWSKKGFPWEIAYAALHADDVYLDERDIEDEAME